jgi:hypothetical protein
MTARPDIARSGSAPECQEPLGADLVAELADFLISRAPALAKEFAAGAQASPAPAAMSWIQLMDDGEIISTNDAATVASVTSQAIRDWCPIAENKGRPIGRSFAGAWFISLSALLDYIELTDSHSARVKAEAIAKKMPKLGSSKAISLKK